MNPVKSHTYYTVVGGALSALFSLLYALLGAKLNEAKTLSFVLCGIGMLVLAFGVVDYFLNRNKEKPFLPLIYLSCGGSILLIATGVSNFFMPVAERSSWNMFLVIFGLIEIALGIGGAFRSGLLIFSLRIGKMVESTYQEAFGEKVNPQNIEGKKFDTDNVIEVDAVDVEERD